MGLRVLKAALLLLLTLPLCSAQNTYYVTPTPDTPCPSGETCQTLAVYALQSFQYFLSSTTFEFLPGDHVLENSIFVDSVTNLTLRGNSVSLPSKIVCQGVSSAMFFSNVSKLTLTALAFSSCGGDTSSQVPSCDFPNSVNESSFFQGGALAVFTSDAIVSNNTFENNYADCGGSVYVVSSTMEFIGNTFRNSNAKWRGGGVDVSNSVVNFTENSFMNNTANQSGGAVGAHNSTLNFIGNDFLCNTAHSHASLGGGVYILNSNLIFTGNTLVNNMASLAGGGVLVNDSNGSFYQNTFLSNKALFGNGSGITMQSFKGTFEGNNFTSNTGHIGGAITISHSIIAFSGETNVFNNTVIGTGGGGLFVEHSNLNFTGVTSFIKNSAPFMGGAVFAYATNVSFEGNVIFKCNNAKYGAAVTVLFWSNVTFGESTQFLNNRANLGGGIFAEDSKITFAGETSFYNNYATNGGAIYASNCNLHMKGYSNFTQNSALNGGGISLTDESKLHFFSKTAIFFQNNYAKETGGAIRVEDNTPLAYCTDDPRIAIITSSDCFFQIFPNETIPTALFFENNTAVKGGGDLYGGVVDACQLLDNINSGMSTEMFNLIFNTTSISSESLGVCVCANNQPNCTQSSLTLQAYPGQVLLISAATFGQRKGRTAGVIQIMLDETRIQFHGLEDIQSTDSMCTNLSYTLLTKDLGSEEQITLYAEGPCETEGKSLTINVTILPCPPGFEFSKKACVCDPRLMGFVDECHIGNQTILRRHDSEFWVGYDNGLILHPQCPFDYCTLDEKNVTVNNSDNQCNYNRSGKLCGSCSNTNSLVLGTSRCMPCSNNYLALILVFVLAGLALVLLLFGLQLTVAVGTINGLIFYANLVQVNSSVFYESGSRNILTVFISWLNLDLGFEICFYNGMDAYDKTWLQFVFPVYVWLLVGVIIFASHYSQRITKALGSNPVAVLATLFLLSYTKLLRTIIAAFSFTYIQYPDGMSATVWPLDGNIKHLKGKHVPLFMTALILLIFLLLPFTLLVFLGQWIQFIQSKYELKVLKWINKPTLRAFLDAYHAPYTNSHRYWTGLLLLARGILFIIVATAGKISANLIAISSIVTGLVTFAVTTKGIYKSHSLGILEASFFLNLVILSAATYYVRATGGNQAAATFTLLSIVFVTFIGIIVYHIFLHIRGTALWERTTEKFLNLLDNFKRMCITNSYAPTNSEKEENNNDENNKEDLTVSTTFVDLRELLISDD